MAEDNCVGLGCVGYLLTIYLYISTLLINYKRGATRGSRATSRDSRGRSSSVRRTSESIFTVSACVAIATCKRGTRMTISTTRMRVRHLSTLLSAKSTSDRVTGLGTSKGTGLSRSTNCLIRHTLRLCRRASNAFSVTVCPIVRT